MTVEAARRSGFATAVKGMFGWQAQCTLCNWNHFITGFPYKGDAAKVAAEHNRKYHPVNTRRGVR